MAVRPPQQDDDEPESLAFGIAALTTELEDASLTYPATGDEVIGALEDPAVPYNAAGNTVALSTALDDVATEEFESKRDLLDSLHPVFERRRRKSTGLVGRLRALLPF